MPDVHTNEPLQEGFVRQTHPYAFRSGQWAQIVGVDESTYARPCFLVVFPDGASDAWACIDQEAGYEFATEAPYA